MLHIHPSMSISIKAAVWKSSCCLLSSFLLQQPLLLEARCIRELHSECRCSSHTLAWQPEHPINRTSRQKTRHDTTNTNEDRKKEVQNTLDNYFYTPLHHVGLTLNGCQQLNYQWLALASLPASFVIVLTDRRRLISS